MLEFCRRVIDTYSRYSNARRIRIEGEFFQIDFAVEGLVEKILVDQIFIPFRIKKEPPQSLGRRILIQDVAKFRDILLKT